jgi:hypothetical protein
MPLSELESVLRSPAGRRPDEIIETIQRWLLPAGDPQPRDDIAIVVLQPSNDRAKAAGIDDRRGWRLDTRSSAAGHDLDAANRGPPPRQALDARDTVDG